MMIKKKKVCTEVSKDLYTNIVTACFDYLESTGRDFSCKAISEILRYSLCKVLNLSSELASNDYIEITKGVVNVITPVIPLDVLNSSERYRQGVLEACVHCVEYAREKVEK